MRFVHKFNNFINEEWSKNDPIPELTREEKLGIVLLGTPGIGKSTFIKEYIHPRNFNLKVFSTDDVSLTFTKDPNVYHQTASDLNLNRLLQFLDTEQGFIYDTTGTQEQNILKVYNSAKSEGYKVIFIHLMGSLEQALSGNVQRTRKVPEDYLKASYDKQQKSIELYSSLNPDGYYIVERVDSGYNISNLENKDKLIRTFEAYVETPKFFRFSKSKMIDVDDTEVTPTLKKALWGSERFNEILIGFGFPDQMKCIHFLDELAFDLFLKNLYGEHIYQIIIDDESDLGWSFFIPINDWYYKSNSYYYELKRNVEFQELHKGEFGQFNSHNEPIDDEDVKATQILIDKGFIGKGKLTDLMSSRFFGKAKVFVSTTDKVKVRNYQQAAKPLKDPKPYVNKPVLTKDDFISSGISPEKIADFWKSDFGRKVQKMRDTADFYLRREEALRLLKLWTNSTKVTESYENKDDVDDIVGTMLDFIDDGEDISFTSTSGEMKYQDYLDKNTRYENFKPVMKGGNVIISKFTIIYRPKNKSYDGLIDLMDNMKSCIGRLKDLGWTLVDFNLKSNRYVTAKPVDFSYTQFKFEKPDIVLDEEFKVPEEDEIIDKIESLGIPVREVLDEDDMIRVDFGSNAYDGELNSEAWYDEKFEIVCDFFGFAGYDLQYLKARVYFEY